MLDPYVSRSGKLLGRERVFLIGDIKWFNSLANRPPWLESRKSTSYFVTVDTVAAKIRATTVCILDPAPRHDLLDHRGYVADLIVLFSPTDINCFVMNQFPGRLESR